MTPYRVVIADDHAVLRAGLRSFLEEQEDPAILVVGEAASGEQAVALVQELRPDLLLLDLSLEGMGGLEVTIELRRRGAVTRVLVLTQYGEPMLLHRLLQAGANGYALKSARAEDLLAAIRAVLGGGTYIDPRLAGSVVKALANGSPAACSEEEAFARLTPRETQVLKLVAEGHSYKEIATALGVAVKTVMVHRFNLTEKLGIRNRSKLIQFAIRAGLLPMDGGLRK